MTGISDVISQTWEIINNPNVSHHDSLHALSLVADCNERRLDMASNGSIIEDGIRFVQEARQRLVTITPESAKEMLHDDNNNSDDVNINDAYNAKEEVMNKEQGEVGGERDEKNNRGKNNNSSSSDGNSGSSTSSSCSDHEQKTSYAADTTNELLQQQQDNDRDEKSSNSNKEGMFKQGKKPRNTVF
jgi:hypothetical protein